MGFIHKPEYTDLVENFHSFYADFWSDRWPQIYQAISLPPVKVRFFPNSSDYQRTLESQEQNESKACFPFVNSLSLEDEPGPIPRTQEGKLSYYVLDPASLFVGCLARGNAEENVLDLCAAPGGKSLVMISIGSPSASYCLNEKSRERFFKLKKNLQQYLSEERFRNLTWSNRPGGLFGKTHQQVFDRILVDAPCSGERFLIQHPAELKVWKPSRSKRLAQEQYALLTAAFLALKPGGTLIYSTCSLSRFENDDVIDRLCERAKGAAQVQEDFMYLWPRPEGGVNVSGLDKTKNGWIFMPDRFGFGPLYFSVIQKAELGLT